MESGSIQHKAFFYRLHFRLEGQLWDKDSGFVAEKYLKTSKDNKVLITGSFSRVWFKQLTELLKHPVAVWAPNKKPPNPWAGNL